MNLGTARDGTQDGAAKAARSGWTTPIWDPVSYTHLDVYKRQTVHSGTPQVVVADKNDGVALQRGLAEVGKDGRTHGGWVVRVFGGGDASSHALSGALAQRIPLKVVSPCQGIASHTLIRSRWSMLLC